MHPAPETHRGEVLCVSHKLENAAARSTFLHFAVKCLCGLAVTQRGIKQNDVVDRRSHQLPTRSHQAEKHRLSAASTAAAAVEVDGSVENGTFTLKVPAVCLFASFSHSELLPQESQGEKKKKKLFQLLRSSSLAIFAFL